jgi:hypothetical protein
MVILILVGMLMLSAVLSINAVRPIFGVLLLFVALYLGYLTACLLPGYARTRTASPTGRMPPQVRTPATSAIATTGASGAPISR